MKPIHFFSLALLSLLCACSGDQDAIDATPFAESLPVSVAQVSLAGAAAFVGEAPASRATTAVSDKTYQLGVIRAAEGPYTAVWNTPYKYAPSGWASTTPIAVDHREATFYAYYPYHVARANYAGLSSGYEFTLSAQAYSASEDICISAAAQKVTNSASTKPILSFTDMPHVYSRIRLTLTRGVASESTGVYSITNINFKNGATFAPTATQNIQSKAVTPTYIYAGWDYTPNITLPAGATAPVIDLLVPPQSVEHGLMMMFTIDGHKRSVTISSSVFTGNELVAGEQYSIALTLRDVEIAMDGTVQIGEWSEETKSKDTYGRDEYVPYINLPEIGLRVAKGNLMRSGAEGHWYMAPDQGFYTSKSKGGDYFNWGTTDPTNYMTNKGDLYGLNYGCISALGPAWRIATKKDYEKLSSVIRFWGTYKSQCGESQGMYFGIIYQPDQSEQDAHPFFPAAGYRYNDNGAYETNTTGYYWTTSILGFRIPEHMEITKNSILYQIPFDTNYLGRAIRCVADN